MSAAQGASTSMTGGASKTAMDKLAYIERYNFEVSIILVRSIDAIIKASWLFFTLIC